MADLILDRYEPTAVVGMGGQGYVLHAVDRRHDRAVAIKVCNAPTEEGRAALLSEARTLLTVDPNPHLPLVREDFFLGERYCIVMDWIEGISLNGLLASSVTSRLPIDVVLEVIDQVALALDHLHTHDPPVMHLDVKPANVIRRPDGRYVLVDFGLSGRRAATYAPGTPAYVAPEIASAGAITPAADIFSLAVTTLELLTGDVPAPGARPRWDVLPAEKVETVRRAVHHALAIDPLARPASAGAFARMLRPPVQTNLPSQPSSFVGRAAELEEVARLLRDARCLSLVGVGGVGKTRLALEIAHAARPTFDCVWVIDLVALNDPDALTGHVRRIVGLREEPGRAPDEALVDHLARGRQLLVLDNCEHLIDASARLVEALLRACPQLTIVATSRERLRTTGEMVWRVPPMQVAEDEADPADSDSVRLFCERARSADHRFAATEETLRTVAGICRRLEGIPLAVELAAALIGEQPVEQIAAGLDRPLALLVRGRRSDPRHETLRATLRWSYDLLSGEEQTLLAQLSVFAGSFTAGAAEAVSGSPHSGMVLGSLVSRSLCELREAAGGLYRLLEPVRQFAEERLEGTGEASSVRDRHLQWHLRCVLDESAKLRGPDQTAAFDVLEALYDDVRTAIAYALGSGAEEDALAIAASLGPFWRARGRWSEGRQTIERCLAAGTRSDHSVPAQIELGAIARLQGDLSSAETAYERARESSQDGSSLARARLGLAMLHADQGNHESARVEIEDVLAHARTADAGQLVGDSLAHLAVTAHFSGDLNLAGRYYDEAIAIARSLGDLGAIAQRLGARGAVAISTGEPQRARSLLEEARDLSRRINDDGLVATVTSYLANCASRDRDYELARELFEESVAIFRRLGHQWRIAQTLNELAEPVAKLEEYDVAIAHLEESRTIATRLGFDLVVGESLHKLSQLAHARGDLRGSFDYLAQALTVCSEHHDGLRLILLVEHATMLAADVDRPVDAIELHASASAERERVGFVRPQMSLLENTRAHAAERLEPHVRWAAEQRGATTSLDHAVQHAQRLCEDMGRALDAEAARSDAGTRAP